MPGHKFAFSLISRYRSDFGINYASGIIFDEPIGPVEDVDECISIDQEILDQRGLNQSPFNEELKSVFNYGMGAEVYISPTLSLLGSFTSDYSAFISNANLFDLLNQSAKNVNVLNDFWHLGFGVDLKIKNFGDLVLGATYSGTSSDLDDQPDIPGGDTSPSVGDPLEIGTEIGVERWRFVLGIVFGQLRKKLEQIPDSLLEKKKEEEEKD